MKIMCKFKRTTGTVFACKQFDIHRVEDKDNYCELILQTVGSDGEWTEEVHNVVGTMDQVLAEIERDK